MNGCVIAQPYDSLFFPLFFISRKENQSTFSHFTRNSKQCLMVAVGVLIKIESLTFLKGFMNDLGNYPPPDIVQM